MKKSTKLPAHKKITKTQSAAIIKKNKGIIGVTYVKKNGEKRLIFCRNVKNKTGSPRKITDNILGYTTVFDITKGDYRRINFQTVMSIETGIGKMIVK